MKTLLTIAFIFLLSLTLVAQPERKSVVIGAMTTRPNALLIVNPQNSNQGVLLPQLSTGQRLAMRPTSPHEDGLIVYDKNANSYYYWSNGNWKKLNAEEGSKSSFLAIDPVHFRELKPDNNVRHANTVIFESDDTFITASRNGQGEVIMAPVNLPHGAVIKEVTIFYLDNDDDNIRVTLTRKRFSGSAELLATWTSSGMSSTTSNVTLNSFNNREKIDVENFTYRLTVTFDLDDNEDIDTPAEARQRLYGIRIRYEQ